MQEVAYRYAQEEDLPLILSYIKQLAAFEKLSDEVKADEATLKEWLFDKERAKVLFPMVNDRPIGFSLFFYNFSTFLGRSGLYIEDLFIEEEYRGKGYGGALLRKLFDIAKEEKLGRVEWCCLNDNPAMEFYVSQGAEPLLEWSMLRYDRL